MAKMRHVALSRPGLGPLAAAGDRRGAARPDLAFVAAVAALIVIQAGLMLRDGASMLDGFLVDPDAYMRLARVQYLWEGGAWTDPVFPRIGPPEGFAHHWTRPLDALLLAGAWLAGPWLPFETALYWWGAFVSPVLQVLALAAFVWAAAPVLSRLSLSLLSFFFVLQPAIFNAFFVGRPDHHGLLALLFIVGIGCTIRLLRDPGGARYALLGGLVAGLAIWISVEALVFVLVSIAALGLFWLLGEARFARALVVHSVAIVVALAVALLLESGPGSLGATDTDRISALHLALFAVVLAFWAGVAGAERRGVMPKGLVGRAAWAALGGAAALAVLWALAPGLFADPLAKGGELYVTKHLAHIEELKPIIKHGAGAAGSWSGIASETLLWLGPAVVAVPWLVTAIVRSAGAERRVWLTIALAMLVVVPLAVAQIRWSMYPQILLLLPYAAFAGAVLDRVVAHLSDRAVPIVRPLLIFALSFWFYVPALLSSSPAEAGSPSGTTGGCPIKALAPILNDPAGLGAAPKTVLAFVDFGPELLYRTRHAVLAIPNHRFQPGFATAYEIMTATEAATAQRLLDGARIDLIVVCPGSAESWFYRTEDTDPTLHERLSGDMAPNFLDPVPLPGDLAGRIKLYSVRHADEREPSTAPTGHISG